MEELKIKKYDMLSKLFLGIIGLLITFYLGISQHKIQKKQDEYTKSQDELKSFTQVEQKKFQILKIVNDNLPFYSELDKKGEIARAIINNSASKLSEEYDFPDLAEILDRVISSDIVLQEALSENDKMIITEASSVISGEKDWFCVIGSFSIRKFNSAKSFAIKVDSILKNSDSKIDVHIYKTMISNNYAVTLGESLTKEKAQEYVDIARFNNIARDAFYQINRDWKKIE